MELDHEIFCTVKSTPSTGSRRVVLSCAGSIQVNCLLYNSQACPGKSVVRLIDHLDMIIAVDWGGGVRPQTKQKIEVSVCHFNLFSRQGLIKLTGNFCCLLITYANSFDPDQSR